MLKTDVKIIRKLNINAMVLPFPIGSGMSGSGGPIPKIKKNPWLVKKSAENSEIKKINKFEWLFLPEAVY